MQPQGHVQLLMNMLVRGMDPQAAIDAPRFCIRNGLANGAIALESCKSTLRKGSDEEIDGNDSHGSEREDSIAEELRKLGHDVVIVRGHDRAEMGRAQVSFGKHKRLLTWEAIASES